MLTALAVLLLLLLALLAIPLTLAFDLSWQRDLEGRIELQWAFGLVRLQIPLSPETKRPPAPEERPKRRRRRAPAKGGGRTNPLALIRNKAFRRRIGRFIRDLWQAVQKRDLSVRLRVGLGDPADTGMLWALVGPVAGMLGNTREARIAVEPDFMEPVFEFNGSGTVRLVPLQLIGLTLAMLLSPTLWQGLRQARQGG